MIDNPLVLFMPSGKRGHFPIGTPILDLEPLPAGGVYVIEMSSYQIDLTFNLRPEVAIRALPKT